MFKQQCARCSKTFIVTDNDQAFYEKINVDEPTHCPTCRLLRRLAWRNERFLYQRQCDLCKKTIISNYSLDKPYIVYCHDCWWSDKWNALDYGQDINWFEPFFLQVQKLLQQVPLLATMVSKCENCDYTNYSFENKNCYLSFDIGGNENVYYSRTMYNNKDCFDCLFCKEHCELCYECVYCTACYGCNFCLDCEHLTNCSFCFDCSGCNDCFLCFNLRNAQYCIENKQYTKEQYQKKIKQYYNLASYPRLQQLKQHFQDLKLKQPHRFSKNIATENSVGDHLQHCTNCTFVFSSNNCENAHYVFESMIGQDFYDDNFSGWGAELSYETIGIPKPYHCMGIVSCGYPIELYYSLFAQQAKQCFGVVATKNTQYCILNKQYTKEQYEHLLPKLIAHMRQTSEWGEFFPKAMSPFCYNETLANEVQPLTKTEILAQGLCWKDLDFKTTQYSAVNIPNTISDVTDKIIQQMLICQHCHKSYKIIPQELVFYHQQQLTLPRLCPNCRHLQRKKFINAYNFWHRQCMCTQPDHNHSGRCSVEFETTYSPEQKELVYCEECYKKEIY
ncbi:MAG: zinc-ribbon domain containing protein [Patescibacteria group bacterium]|jgi:hypothetical protein